MQTIAAYIRVSSDKQDVTRQRESINRWSQNSGKPIALWFEDSQGKNPRDLAHKREGFQRLMKAVEAGLVSCIVVDSQDRFGTRDAHQWGHFLTLLRDNDCILVDASGKELSGDDDASVLSSVVGALTSSREQKEKAKRSLGGKIEKAKRGEYQGGYPPYGFDVVCFAGDKEKWRTVYYDHFDRFKVYPDGSRELFKGKDNSPRKDATDTLFYRPTIERERLKIVKQIFTWYATEAISPRQLASRLNELKVDPVFGETWDKVKISSLLRNPVYIGRPAWNKRGGSRFVEYVDGQLCELKGKVKLGRKRTAANFLAADKPQFKPIIDQETWDKTQRKIEVASGEQPAKRPAQTADLWLRPFLICGQCSKPMHASNGRSTARLWPSYFCGTYGTYGGADNPTGCHCHRVRHEVIERIVLDYLGKTAPKVAKLLAATKAGDLEAARPLLEAVTNAAQDYLGTGTEILEFVRGRATDHEISRLLKQGKDFAAIYGILYERMRPAIEKEIAAKDQEIERLLDQYGDLKGRVRERARDRMDILQADIDRLQAQLVDLREPWGDLKGELEARRAAFKQAQHTLSNGATGRQKTEVLTGIVDRVICHFRHTATKAQMHNGKSYLETVEIVPVSGDKLCFGNGNVLERD